MRAVVVVCIGGSRREVHGRMLLCVQARVQTKWLKMLFAYSYGDTIVSGGRDVFVRKLPYGTTEEIPAKSVRSHIVKHGASDNAAASGVPWPVGMQVIAPHSFHVMSRYAASHCYLPLSINPVRSTARASRKQADVPNIPEEGGPRSRRVAAAAERPTWIATYGPCVLQPRCHACRQDGADAQQLLARARGTDTPLEVTLGVRSAADVYTRCTFSDRCVYTAMQQVYTFVSRSIHITFICVYIRRSHKYTHRDMCISIQTIVYTHSRCVYTHRLTTPVGGAYTAQHGGYGQGRGIPAADADESLV